jgi:hypothetical protein
MDWNGENQNSIIQFPEGRMIKLEEVFDIK